MNLNCTMAHLNPDRFDKLLPISERIVPLELPECESNGFKIEKMVFPAEKRLEMTMYGGFVRYDDEVVITKLTHNGALWMSDSPSELRDMEGLIQTSRAKGNVFVAGLGMGLLSAMLLDTEEVDSIFVVEISQEVIDLVWHHIEKKASETGKKAMVVCSDAKVWVDTNDLEEFDAFILDIWGNISSDDLDLMLTIWKNITNKYGEIPAGAIWGLDMAVECIMQYVRGYSMPSETAEQLEYEYGMSFIADHIYSCYLDDDFGYEDDSEEWSDYEDEAVREAFAEVYGLYV